MFIHLHHKEHFIFKHRTCGALSFKLSVGIYLANWPVQLCNGDIYPFLKKHAHIEYNCRTLLPHLIIYIRVILLATTI